MGVITKLPTILDPIPGGKSMVNAVDFVVNWARANSLWPLTYATSCCAIEMMATSMSRYDISRFGSEVFRASPRQADLIILAGTIVEKMAEPLVTLYEQLPGPKYVIAMGACTISGGPFYYDNYSVVKGADRLIPVDVYIPGCPPRPEALLHGLMLLQKKIMAETLRHPWSEGPINTSPISNPFADSMQTWNLSEKAKDQKEAEAREKFKADNPDYKPYKHIRIQKEAFPEVAQQAPEAHGLKKSEIFEKFSKQFPTVQVLGLENPSAEAIDALNAAEPLNMAIEKTDYFELVQFAKSDSSLNFDFLFDIVAVDWKDRFELVVQLLSTTHGHKVHIRCSLPKDPQASATEIQAKISSLNGIFSASEWKEREVFDLFGISFEGHPDMRRLFLKDDFVGFPFRKDFTSTAMVPRGY